jgi:hypothetical protein
MLKALIALNPEGFEHMITVRDLFEFAGNALVTALGAVLFGLVLRAALKNRNGKDN